MTFRGHLQPAKNAEDPELERLVFPPYSYEDKLATLGRKLLEDLGAKKVMALRRDKAGGGVSPCPPRFPKGG